MNGELKSGAGNVVPALSGAGTVAPTLKKMSEYTDPNAVHYKREYKTDDEKKQARENIGAADAGRQAEHENTLVAQGEQVAEHDERMAQMEARMNTFASLPDGSTTGDAEIADIRVGYDAKTYPTAGEAVRGQVGKLTEDIADVVDGLDVFTTGKMSIKNEVVWENGWYSTNGTKESSKRDLRSVGKYLITPSMTIKFVGTKNDAENRNLVHRAHFFDKKGEYISRSMTSEYKVPQNACYVAFSFGYHSDNTTYPSLDTEEDKNALLSYWDVEISTEMTSAFLGRYVSWTSVSDFNDVVEPGAYYITNAESKVILNTPEDRGGTLLVFKSNSGHAKAGTVQVYETVSNKTYIRFSTTKYWTSWKELVSQDIDKRIVYKSYEAETSKLLGIYASAFREWTTVNDSLLDIAHWDDNGNYETLDEGEVKEGIIYSSAHQTGGDVFINRNLSTYYSAMKNPYSVLYTKPLNTNHNTSKSKCTWYGTVCSTFLAAMLGKDIYYRSIEIKNNYSELGYEKVEITKFDDFDKVRPGMVIYTPGHVQLIYDVGLTSKGKKCIGIVEAYVPLTRFVEYTWEEIYKNFIGESAPYMLLITEIDENRAKERFEVEEYATDLIADYGNNTWYVLGDAVTLYNPNKATTLFYRKEDDDVWHTINVSDENVDVTGVINSAGVWQFTTDTKNNTYCNVEMIDFGDATIDGAEQKITVRNYSETITPFYVEIMHTKNIETGSASTTFARAMFDGNTAKYETDLQSYWVRCYFKTLYGMAFVDVPHNNPPTTGDIVDGDD